MAQSSHIYAYPSAESFHSNADGIDYDSNLEHYECARHVHLGNRHAFRLPNA